jgi:outer membrane protein
MTKSQKIKRFLLPITLIFGCSFNSFIQAQDVVMLTLEQSVTYALENNVEVKNAQLELMTSQAIVGENLSRGLPQIVGNYDFSHNLAIPLVFLPNEGPFADPDLDSDVIAARFGVPFQSSLGVRVDQMIFDGSYFVGLKAAKTLKLLTTYDQEKTQNDVVENVKKAYFTVLVNDERRKVVEANLERIETLLSNTEALFEEGFAEKLDVSRIKVQRNNLQTELDKINTATAISVELLKIQLGIPLTYRIQINEKLDELNSQEELLSLLENEGERRVEMDQLNTNMELVELDLKNNQIQYMPKINGFLTYQRSGAALQFTNIWNSDNWFTSSVLGLNMSIPIFDGLMKSNRIQQNRVQIRQLQNQREFLAESFEIEKFQSKSNLRNSLRALEVQKENRDLAMEVFEMTKIKFEEGVGSNFEVVEADSALKEAEANYFAALYDALVAKVDLEKALGLLK